MRLKSSPSALRQGAHHERLGGPRQSGDQAVAADERGDQQLLDDRLLADDDAAKRFPDGRHGGVEMDHDFLGRAG